MEAQAKHDITTEADVKLMVDSFYEKVNSNKLLSYIFNDFAGVNWPEHLPKMYKFWNSLLLGIQGYKGQPFPLHNKLPINQEHFDKWVELFKQNIDEQFEGPVAEEAKARGGHIAMIFQYKMGIIK